MLLAAFHLLASAAPFPGCRGGTLEGCPGSANCSEHFLSQKIDHFNWAPPLGDSYALTFKQRFFVYDRWWDRSKDGPVFFYFGNEDNVELYVNHTGLMWESAEEFGALLVFGEHRYYGESLPYKPHTPGCMSFLTTEQAMADFAYLIDHLREDWGAARSPFIGFGGSYGGMLGAWFRVHYPNAIDGVIAASAPIWSFVGLRPPYDYNAFNKGVTFDASTAGGAADACKTNLKAAWPRILGAGETASGRQVLADAFRTCSPVRPKSGTVDDALAIVRWAEAVWATMAMGNYPYASSYLLHGKSLLPPWPVRAACAHLKAVHAAKDSDRVLFEAVREAAATMYNNTGDKACFDIPGQSSAAVGPSASSPALLHADEQVQRHTRMASKPPAPRALWAGEPATAASAHHRSTFSPADRCTGDWDYQWCTEMTQPFTQGTDDDLFYCPNGTFHRAENCSAWSVGSEGCEMEWGVSPRPEWARVALGGKRIEDASNIVFSNGLQDPWHGGGVLHNLSDTVLAVVLPNGAHHIDLMFSDPVDADYPDIGWARGFERAQIKKWVAEHQRKLSAHSIAREEP